MISKEIKTQIGLILSNVQYKDSSSIVTLAGNEGIFTCIAKGIYKAKSSLKPLLIIGSLVKIEYNSSKENINFANNVEVISDFSSLMSDYEKSIFLLYLQEMTLKLFNYGDTFPFKETNEILNAIKEGKDLLSLSILFLGCLYNSLGIKPNTHECVRCSNKKNIVAISFLDGGFICNKCIDNQDLFCEDEMDLYVFKYAFSQINEENLNRKVPKESGIKILSLLNDHLLDYFEGGKAKSFSMLLSLFK